MKHAVSSLTIGLILLTGCERQIPLLQSRPIIGYQIQGVVTDRVGNPIPNVSVVVDYFWDTVSSDSAATRRYFVSDSSFPIQAVVADWSGRVVRILTPLQKYRGPYEILWDGNDTTGTTIPSGIYYIEYVVGGTVRFSYSQLVSGGIVAKTDQQGHYVIPIQNLPIDSSSVPVFTVSDSSFVGNLIVLNDVVLSYLYPSHLQQVEQTLSKDMVTIVNVTF